MIDKARKLTVSDPKYRTVIQMVLETPYIGRDALEKKTGLTGGSLDVLTDALKEEMVIIELASTPESSLESRVPKRSYLINPELEDEIRDII